MTSTQAMSSATELPPKTAAASTATPDRLLLASACEFLPHKDQLLLALLYVEEFSYAETALVLDMSVADVVERSRSAMVALMELLNSSCSLTKQS